MARSPRRRIGAGAARRDDDDSANGSTAQRTTPAKEEMGASGNEPEPLLPTVVATVAVAAVLVLYYMYRQSSSMQTGEARGDQAAAGPPALPAAPPQPPKFRTLDGRCGVWLTDEFLSAAEIDHLLTNIERLGGWAPSPTGGPHFQQPKALHQGFSQWLNRDPVVRRIEERIAAATGIAVHPHEDRLSLARITSRGNTVRGGYYMPFGLHHESDTRPYRSRTLLVYLTDVDEGGSTIFPLCGRVPGGSAEAALRSERPAEMTEMLPMRHGMFASGLGGLFGGRAESFSRHVSFDVTSDHPFNDLLEETCRGRYGLRVRPRRGSAILFNSMHHPKTTVNNATWHGGCNVVRGTKIIMQKFKELPLAQRAHPADGNADPYFPYEPVEDA